MSGSFDLTLRTQAPVITWGSVSGNVPGGSFSVAYTVDEPAILAARLIDFDGVVWPLTIDPAAFTASLPDTVALGQATVEADVLDDVDNATTRTLTLAIQATIIPPAPIERIVSGGVPRETPRIKPRTSRHSRSAVSIRTTSRALVAAVQQTSVAASTQSRASTAHGSSSAIHVSTMFSQTAHLKVATAVTLSTTERVRRDESQIALLALLLA